MANAEVLNLAMKALEMNRKEWRQDTWRCGTSCCYAGFIALSQGAVWRNENECDDCIITPDGAVMHVADYATEVAELDDMERYKLFEADNSFRQLKARVKRVASK